MTEYQTFVRRFSDLTSGKCVLFIKDLTAGPRKYDTRLVFAEVSDQPEDHPDWDRLWLRSEAGRKSEQPWAIHVVEEIGETIEGRPYEDVFTLTKQLTEKFRN